MSLLVDVSGYDSHVLHILSPLFGIGPVRGGLAVPSMALINYVVYRSAYRKLVLER